MEKIQTKYPFLLVHGFGFRDHERRSYWGRIPKMLEKRGVRIYYGYQDANATIEENAQKLAEEIHRLAAEGQISKLNVIAHSKGGLDMRYAIARLDIAPYIASLTTIATPHHGSKTADAMLKVPKPVVRLIAKIADGWRKICGDRRPDSYHAFCSFSTKAAEKFNRENPNNPAVYYQSYAFVMKHHLSDLFFSVPHLVVSIFEGENDGFLAPEAVRWGEFRGVYTGMGRKGISHWDEVDFRRCAFPREKDSGKTKKQSSQRQKRSKQHAKYDSVSVHRQGRHPISSILGFYLKLVQELAEKGY